MSTNTNNIKLIGGVAIAAALGYYFFFREENPGGSPYDPTGNGGPMGPGPGPAFDANSIANGLYRAMETSGTQEGDILSLLQKVTPQQFGQVFQAFGRKSYNEFLGNQMNPTPWDPLPLKNLKEWLANELSSQEYGILKLKYPNHL